MRRKISFWSIVVIFTMFVVGCATSPYRPTEQAVMTYEDVGFTLSIAKTMFSQMEKDGSLTGDRLAETKKLYNDAREAYLSAGDAMKRMVDSPDPIVRQDARTIYRQSLLLAANLAMQLSKIMGGK